MTNYHRLIRNLRKGNHLKLRIMEPPIALVAFARLLSNLGIKVRICKPGTHSLPLSKAAIWRIAHQSETSLFEITIHSEKCYVRRVTTTGTFMGYSSKLVTIELADPNADQKTIETINNWKD